MNVKLTAEEIDEIAEAIGAQKCPYDFICYKSGFEDLCGAVLGPILDSGTAVVECVDEKSERCHYASPFGSTFICTCPVRCYIARHFHK